MTRPAARPRLDAALDLALAHRLTILVADAGFGKTTVLSSWTAGIHAVVLQVTRHDRDLTTFWRHLAAAFRRRLGDLPELSATVEPLRGPGSARSERIRAQAMAELLGHVLEQRLTRDLVLVLDDLHLLAGDGTGDGETGSADPAAGAAELVAGLVRHAPPLLHLVISTRVPPAMATARLSAQGEVLEITGNDLRFTVEEITTLLAGLLPAPPDAASPGPETPRLAAEIRAATGGWPIAVRLAVEALREVPPAGRSARVAQLAGSGGQLSELVRTIYQREPAATQRLLAVAALFGRFSAGLCQALGVAGADELISGLARRGLLIEPDGAAAGGEQWYRLHPLAQRLLAGTAALPPEQSAALHARAAGWFAANGWADAALRSLAIAGDPDRTVALLAGSGEALVRAGRAGAVLAAIDALPPARRDPALELLAGNAHLVRGDWERAQACYTAAAGDGTRQPPGLAWRIGLIHYLRGEHDQALAAYQRGDLTGEPDRDHAMLLAWAAAAHWIRGEAATCGELAARSLGIATAAGDPAALAAAHTVLSMLAALEGNRRANAAHYVRALEYAERAGDVLQLIRIHSNRASHHLEEGTYHEAMADLDTAIQLADLSSYGVFGALALHNRAEIRIRLGQLEEAYRDVQASLAIFEDLGSRQAAYPLRLQGLVRHLRGDRSGARRAYERALALATASGDLQATVPALAGLARLLADEDGERAESLAAQALSHGEGLGYVEALLAAARVALARGDRAAALAHLPVARQVAQTRRDRAGLAEAAEIESLAVQDAARARELAGQAAAGWAELGDPIGRAAAELAYADRLDAPAARAGAATVQREMAAIGCRWLVERAAAVAARHTQAAPVRLETLGAFRLTRQGVPVPANAWRSRKARDTLKILLARRGRPVTRDFLIETLWPDDPSPAAGVLANRLHVAVSTLRAVLDPERRFDSDWFVVTDDEAIRAQVEHLDVDVESFLSDADLGLDRLRAGHRDQALPLLAQAERRYAGEFLEEDLYADWAVPLREQARAAYLAVAAQLADHAERAGDLDAATRYRLRLLEHDPYDERAHLRLVSTLVAEGRHGDARRHYRHYCARMAELEVEAAPYPGAGLKPG